jgi:peroxiredoxin
MKVLFACLPLAVTLSSLTGCTPTGPKDPSGNLPPAAGGVAEIGKPAPELSAEYVKGDGPKTLAEARGTVTIVDFWGTFCEPCKKSFPKLQEMVDTQGGKLSLIAVSQDDPEEKTKEDIAKFGDELKVSFPLVWDKEKKSAASYKPPKMPTSYVIDKKGVLRHVHGGYTEDEAEVLSKEIEALMAEN